MAVIVKQLSKQETLYNKKAATVLVAAFLVLYVNY